MLTRATTLSLLTFAACTGAFAPQGHKPPPLTRRRFTEVPEALETARFVRVDPESTDTKPVLLALGGLDGSPRVGARNWKRLGEWFDVRALVLVVLLLQVLLTQIMVVKVQTVQTQFLQL